MKQGVGFLGVAIMSAVVLSGCVAYGEAYIPAPPAARVEIIAVAPVPGAIWVPGYWSWHRRHRQYTWVPGYWRGRGYGHQYEHRHYEHRHYEHRY